MPRFFVGAVSGDQAVVTGEDARHMALSLRMRPGEAVTVCDSAGNDYQCVIQRIDPQQVVLQVAQVSRSAGEPSVQITLYQALSKGDKMDWIAHPPVHLPAGRPLVGAEGGAVEPDCKGSRQTVRKREISPGGGAAGAAPGFGTDPGGSTGDLFL